MLVNDQHDQKITVNFPTSNRRILSNKQEHSTLNFCPDRDSSPGPERRRKKKDLARKTHLFRLSKKRKKEKKNISCSCAARAEEEEEKSHNNTSTAHLNVISFSRPQSQEEKSISKTIYCGAEKDSNFFSILQFGQSLALSPNFSCHDLQAHTIWYQNLG